MLNLFSPVEKPNIPNTKIKLAVIGDYAELESSLNLLGIETIKLKKCNGLLKPLHSHADILCCHLGKEDIILENCQNDASKRLEGLGFKPIMLHNDLKNKYPYDAPLNAAIFGDYIVANTQTVSQNILNYFKKREYEILDVNQGYSKCSICVVNSNAIITDDLSIYNSCKPYDIDVLLVEKGSVKLEGHNYGFIGGCCGLIDENLMAFCGDINKHSDADKIKGFLKNYSIDTIALFSSDLIDVGGILPLTI